MESSLCMAGMFILLHHGTRTAGAAALPGYLSLLLAWAVISTLSSLTSQASLCPSHCRGSPGNKVQSQCPSQAAWPAINIWHITKGTLVDGKGKMKQEREGQGGILIGCRGNQCLHVIKNNGCNATVSLASTLK